MIGRIRCLAAGTGIVAATFLGLAGSAPGQEAGRDSRLLWGFEKEEFTKTGVKKVEEKQPGAALVTLTGGRPIPVRKGEASQGEWAAAYSIDAKTWGDAFAGYKPGTYRPLFNFRGDPRGAMYRSHDLLNLSASHAGPAVLSRGERDWSGWGRLRLDVKASADAVVRLGIEDEEVAPAIERKFRIAAGKWVTVELDLEKAVKARGLDLSKMVDLWLFLEELGSPGTLWVDNLRLERAGKTPVLPLVTDDSPYEMQRRDYAIVPFHDGTSTDQGRWTLAEFPEDKPLPGPRDMRLPADLGPWTVGFAEIPPLGSMSRKAEGFTFWSNPARSKRALCPLAFDSRRIAVPVCAPEGVRLYGTVMAVCTADGGKTWTGAGGAGSALPLTYVTDGCGGEASADSGELYVLSNLGCCMDGWPSDRLFFTKLRMTENGWAASPATPVEGDMRHCTVSPTAIRLASGRIWAAWGHWGRFGVLELWAKYSDDGGRTWNSWRPGKRSVLPGADDVGRDAYSHLDLFLVPYGKHVACADLDNNRMWTFDGAKWSEPVALPGLRGKGSSAMPLGENGMLVSNREGIYRFDGAKCVGETVEGLEPGLNAQIWGRFCRSGEQILFFACAGFAGPFSPGNAKPGKILCWRRSADGVWKGPETVADEKEPIVSYTTTRFTDLPFAVVAWRTGNPRQFKVRLVPAERK